VSNLVTGTNTFAVEVHNFSAASPDVTFESALFAMLPPPSAPFITNIVVIRGETNATITWTTLSNSTSQVQFGVTPALGDSTPIDSTPVTNHSVTVAGLQPAMLYYFRIISMAGPSQYSSDGSFTTTTFFVPLVTFSNIWKFETNNLDGTGWMASNYDDSWVGQGSALLYIENNTDVIPRNTPLLATSSGGPFPTYYFRTHFLVSNSLAGLSLLFTNFIDDGAVFYLNGREIQRVRMPAGPVAYSTLASDCPINSCDATFEAPDVFRISGDVMTNIVSGDNVLAAEVHQVGTNDSDVVFGSSAALVRALASETQLRIMRTNNAVCISWDGEFLTLQRTSGLAGTNVWTDVPGTMPGPIKHSPYCTTNPPATTFYRLRN
jgi:hypothetical protein